MSDEATPLLTRWGTDVVGFGPSCGDGEGYVLIRAYASPEDLEASQDGFYGSYAWRQGPRQAILALIEEHASVVLRAEEPTIDALRKVFMSFP